MSDKNLSTDIEIEIVKAIAGAMQRLDNGPVRFENDPQPVWVWNGKNWEKELIQTVDYADNYGILVLLLVFSF